MKHKTFSSANLPTLFLSYWVGLMVRLGLSFLKGRTEKDRKKKTKIKIEGTEVRPGVLAS
jgi:hypothetical protein